MENRTARQVTADRCAQHQRTTEFIHGAPAHRRNFIPKLHERRPDVIEKLYFHDRLEPSRGHAYGTAHDAGFGDRCIVAAGAAEVALQTVRHLEDAALALPSC